MREQYISAPEMGNTMITTKIIHIKRHRTSDIGHRTLKVGHRTLKVGHRTY